MALTFLTISVFAILVFGSSIVIQYFESKPQVIAFFKAEAKQENISELELNLKQTGKISTTRFVSKKEALQIYKEQNKDDPLLLDLVSEDFLPASLEISTYRLEDLSVVSDLLKGSPHVETVVYHKDVVSQLTSWTNAVRTIGITLITILALVSVFIMMTVIGFKVSQKKDEIEIMRLLSATNWYIRWPFILEGILYGMAGAVIGWLIASASLISFTPYLESFLRGIPLFPISPLFFFELLLAELLIAAVLGMVASSLAVLRYLK